MLHLRGRTCIGWRLPPGSERTGAAQHRRRPQIHLLRRLRLEALFDGLL